MSTSTATPACGICESPLTAEDQGCPQCQASPAWREFGDALSFADRRFEDWRQEGAITPDQRQRLQDYYHQRRQEIQAAAKSGAHAPEGTGLPPAEQCWSCHAYALGQNGYCTECLIPMAGPGVRSLRYWKFLEREVNKHEDSGLLTLVQAHDFKNRIKSAMAALRTKLGQERAVPSSQKSPVEAENIAKPTVASVAKAATGPRRTLLEILLDPQSIQWLLASGGVLLVVGLVIWLTSLGVFENPGVVAGTLGLANGLVLLGGWAIIKRTRFQMAGRALTLLACLVMPLNLWFYHAHDLVTLQGHLWIAALVCCGLYAASVLVLRDSLFVYVLCGGITLTGLLFLGDFRMLDEIFAPSALLVCLGLIALHTERAFPEGSGTFTRKSFGLAFFWSAQALLGAGLLLLLGAQLLGIYPQGFWPGPRPAVAELEALPKTLLLVLAGTYAFLYSDLVVRRVGIYIYFAAFTLLWAEIQLLVLLHLTDAAPMVILVLALTGLTANILYFLMGRDKPYLRSVPALGLVLSLVPVLFGVVLHFRATNGVLHEIWHYEINWVHVAALLVTAVCARAGAYFYRHSWPRLSAVYFFATGAATLVGAAGLAWMLDFKPWETQAPFLMIIPIAYLVGSRLYKGHTPEQPLVWLSHASTAVMLVSSLWTALHITHQVVEPITGKPLNLLLMTVCLEAAIFYALAAAFRKEGWNIYLMTTMASGALWQLLVYLNTPHEYFTLVFALAGIGLLIAYRLSLLDGLRIAGLSRAAFQSANALMSLAFLSGGLLTLSRELMPEFQLAQMGSGDWKEPLRTLVILMVMLLALGLLAAWLVQQSNWRRWYIVLTVGNGAALLLLLHRLSQLSPWQQLELFSLIAGTILLAMGYVFWYREQGKELENDSVSFCLLLGSLLVVVPLTVAVAYHRFGHGDNTLSALDEFGLVLASILLFGSGIVCRLKITTLLGAATMLIYLIEVIFYMHRFVKDQILVGIYVTVGGALLFGTGLVLSLYRDRLLALPQKIKRREGIFKILNWR